MRKKRKEWETGKRDGEREMGIGKGKGSLAVYLFSVRSQLLPDWWAAGM